ncbi:uncharacterized protein BO97DRAFT_428524 [Aspergillus homomorphus CBS 101889]|uniref:Uncharacterized protein n=1 Tax=Aspergillus homomorphus (strain CBS 101889) TaxID=1450537 RepID=A0A395HMZ4_ASPHC|nr:hypothetical protein BO97DRAFT_428524 [Aspergillus homomorphus CBS 101889]RAL08218.1 hypothetical protein BO97DRAFT_428524 [Aspergillus homomorphus CBS 101889]
MAANPRSTPSSPRCRCAVPVLWNNMAARKRRAASWKQSQLGGGGGGGAGAGAGEGSCDDAVKRSGDVVMMDAPLLVEATITITTGGGGIAEMDTDMDMVESFTSGVMFYRDKDVKLAEGAQFVWSAQGSFQDVKVEELGGTWVMVPLAAAALNPVPARRGAGSYGGASRMEQLEGLMVKFFDEDGQGRGTQCDRVPVQQRHECRSEPRSSGGGPTQRRGSSGAARRLRCRGIIDAFSAHAASFYVIFHRPAEMLHVHPLCNFDPAMLETTTVSYKVAKDRRGMSISLKFRSSRK